MTKYQKYINALRKCAKEHDNDRTSTGHIIVSDLCRDTANLLEALEQEPCDDCISRQATLEPYKVLKDTDTLCVALIRANIMQQPSVHPKQDTVPFDIELYQAGLMDMPKGMIDVLDKIRTEIEHVIDNTYDSTDYDKSLYNGAYKDGLYDALDIIDKYRAQSEAKE